MSESSASPKVRLYVTQVCGYCTAAKRLLKERGVPFEEIDITHDNETRMKLVSTHHWRTVPVILSGDDPENMALIGGFTELSAMDRSRGLAHLRPVIQDK